jgi:hypothetical protein
MEEDMLLLKQIILVASILGFSAGIPLVGYAAWDPNGNPIATYYDYTNPNIISCDEDKFWVFYQEYDSDEGITKFDIKRTEVNIGGNIGPTRVVTNDGDYYNDIIKDVSWDGEGAVITILSICDSYCTITGQKQ